MKPSTCWDLHTAVGLVLALALVSLHWFQDASAQRRYYSRYSRPRRTSQAPGPNMCKVQEVIGTGQKFFTHCVAKHLKVICERPTFDRWECCPGFRRNGRDKGCSEEKSLGNLLDTADELNLNVFRQYVNQSQYLSKELRHFGAYTVFAPTDEAIKDASQHLKEEISHPDAGLLKYHVAPGRLNISMFRKKNQAFVTLFNGYMVRVNKYAYGVATINCARVVRPDALATNGIIHVIDKVISPDDMDRTLAERLFSDNQFSQFQMALFVSGMVRTLKRKKSSFTVLAPTNKAFAKLPNDILDRILTDADTAEKVVKRHIVNAVYCADAIVVSIGLKTLDDSRLLFRCKRDGLMVNEATVTQKDIVSSNGVVHGINTVLLPDSVKKASELMYDMHLDKFLDMARKAGLNDTFDEDNDVTIFTPSDRAVGRLSPSYLAALSKEPLKMQRLLKYHIVKGRLTENTMIGDTSLSTKADVKVKIKVNVYRNGVSVDKAKLSFVSSPMP